MSGENLKPGTHEGDPDAPWNQPDRDECAPDGWGWEEHADDWGVLLARIDEGFDFDLTDAPLHATYRVIVKREAAEREAARIGFALPKGKVVVEVECPEPDAVNVTPRDLDEKWWPDGIAIDDIEDYAGRAVGVSLERE